MTAVDAFESFGKQHTSEFKSGVITFVLAIGAYTVGKISEEERFDVVRHSCPGPGACGGMFTYVPLRLLRCVFGAHHSFA